LGSRVHVCHTMCRCKYLDCFIFLNCNSMAASQVGSKIVLKGSTPSVDWPAAGTLRLNTDRLTVDDSGNVAVKGNVAVNTNKFNVTASSGNTAIGGTLGVTSDVAVNTNKFTVAAASGNTGIAGTLGVAGDVAVNTNKFNVTAASGNTAVGGTLGVTGNVAVNTDKFVVTAASGNTAIAGDVAVATNKFTVAAASGNTAIAGTLGVTGDVAVNTNKFNVTASSGNTAIAGDVAVATNKFNVTAASGNTAIAGTLGVTGDVAVNTDKFVVTASSGKTAIAGDLAVATNKFNVTAASGNVATAGTLGVTGDLAVNTNKFNVTAASGNTTVGGTLNSVGDLSVATNKFNVTAASGNTAVAGTLGVTGDVAVNTNKFNVTAASGNTTVGGTLNSVGDLSVATNKFNVTAASGNTAIAGTLGVTGTATVGDLVVNGTFSQSTTIVNGGKYALTRAGIQAAVDAVNSAGGGTVLVKGDVTSDGTTITMKSNVTLDFDNHTFKMIASATSYVLITIVGSGASSARSFTADGTEGSPLVTVSTIDAATFAAGDYVLIMDSAATQHAQVSRLSAVNSGTGVLTLTEPLGYTYLVSATAVIYRITTPVTNCCVRNAILDGNGNTGGSSHMIRWIDVINSHMENITVRGTLTTSTTAAVAISQTHNCQFTNIVARDIAVNSASSRAISIYRACACHIKNITSIDCGGSGPILAQSTDTTLDGLVSVRSSGRNFRLDTCSRCVLTNITCSGGISSSGSGFRYASGTKSCTITNITCVGNQDYGIVYDGLTDNCSIFGAYVAANTAGGVVFSGTNNALWGNIIGTITDGVTTSIVNTAGGNVTTPSKLILSNTTASSGSGTGALQVSGGSYIAKDAYFGTGIRVQTGGGTAGLLNYFEPTQSFSTSVNIPGNTPVALPVVVTRVNNMAYLTYGGIPFELFDVGKLTSTQNLPTKWRPTSYKKFQVEVQHGGVYQAGVLKIDTAGLLTWSLQNDTNFNLGPGFGAAGLSSTCVSYDITV